MRKSIYTVEQIDALLSAKGMVIQGAYTSVSDVAAPVEGGHYYIGTEGAYNVYTYIRGAWVNAGSFEGPPGEKGDPFTYEDFTQEQLNDLERGAKAAQAAAEKAAADAEGAAQTAAQEAASAAAEIAAQEAAKNAVEDVGIEMAGYVSAAEAAQTAAEAARDSALDIVGGDYATKTEARGYASTAEANAKSYTDSKVASIPTPDVSGQINTHNTDGSAHADIRTAINTVQSTAAGKVSKSGDTMTGNLTIERPSYPNITTKNTSIDSQFTISEADDGTAIIQNQSDLSGANNFATLYLKTADAGLENVLSLGLQKDGAWSGATILHTGNSNKTRLVSSDTTPSANGEICWTYG